MSVFLKKNKFVKIAALVIFARLPVKQHDENKNSILGMTSMSYFFVLGPRP
jgi:hypothetical protein